MVDRPNYLRRFSCRAFRSEPLPPGAEDALIQAAIRAPSAGNRQPWRVILVESREGKHKLSEAAYGQTFLLQAPIVFVICAVPEESGARYGTRGTTLYCYQDTAAMVQNILLAATDLGLGSCWVGAFDEESVVRILSIPEGWRPVAMVPVGYPSEDCAFTSRRPRNEVVYRYPEALESQR